MQPSGPLQVLELFSGVGGWRYALGTLGRVVAAFDISPAANATYELNHGDRPQARELGRVKLEALRALGADTWLLSPPCQPFCRMGRHKGLEDRRSLAFLHLMEVLREAPPRHLVLENVEGFLGSDAHELLARRLEEGGFHRLEYRLCPSRFGLPNLRPRVFILASQDPLASAPAPELPPVAVGSLLDAVEDPGLYLRPEDLARHGPGLDLAQATSTRTACFIGGYGQRFVGSGSFLETARGVRRFSPMEVARLLGLPGGFRFPADLGLEQRYRLLGNGLSQPVAQGVVAPLGAATTGGGTQQP